MIIETDRLYLREFTENDYDDLREILQDKDVMYAYEKGFIVDFDNRWEKLNTVMKITATREFPSGKIEKQERF